MKIAATVEEIRSAVKAWKLAQRSSTPATEPLRRISASRSAMAWMAASVVKLGRIISR